MPETDLQDPKAINPDKVPDGDRGTTPDADASDDQSNNSAEKASSKNGGGVFDEVHSLLNSPNNIYRNIVSKIESAIHYGSVLGSIALTTTPEAKTDAKTSPKDSLPDAGEGAEKIRQINERKEVNEHLLSVKARVVDKITNLKGIPKGIKTEAEKLFPKPGLAQNLRMLELLDKDKKNPLLTSEMRQALTTYKIVGLNHTAFRLELSQKQFKKSLNSQEKEAVNKAIIEAHKSRFGGLKKTDYALLSEKLGLHADTIKLIEKRYNTASLGEEEQEEDSAKEKNPQGHDGLGTGLLITGALAARQAGVAILRGHQSRQANAGSVTTLPRTDASAPMTPGSNEPDVDLNIDLDILDVTHDFPSEPAEHPSATHVPTDHGAGTASRDMAAQAMFDEIAGELPFDFSTSSSWGSLSAELNHVHTQVPGNYKMEVYHIAGAILAAHEADPELSPSQVFEDLGLTFLPSGTPADEHVPTPVPSRAAGSIENAENNDLNARRTAMTDGNNHERAEPENRSSDVTNAVIEEPIKAPSLPVGENATIMAPEVGAPDPAAVANAIVIDGSLANQTSAANNGAPVTQPADFSRAPVGSPANANIHIRPAEAPAPLTAAERYEVADRLGWVINNADLDLNDPASTQPFLDELIRIHDSDLANGKPQRAFLEIIDAVTSESNTNPMFTVSDALHELGLESLMPQAQAPVAVPPANRGNTHESDLTEDVLRDIHRSLGSRPSEPPAGSSSATGAPAETTTREAAHPAVSDTPTPPATSLSPAEARLTALVAGDTAASALTAEARAQLVTYLDNLQTAIINLEPEDRAKLCAANNVAENQTLLLEGIQESTAEQMGGKLDPVAQGVIERLISNVQSGNETVRSALFPAPADAGGNPPADATGTTVVGSGEAAGAGDLGRTVVDTDASGGVRADAVTLGDLPNLDMEHLKIDKNSKLLADVLEKRIAELKPKDKKTSDEKKELKWLEKNHQQWAAEEPYIRGKFWQKVTEGKGLEAARSENGLRLKGAGGLVLTVSLLSVAGIGLFIGLGGNSARASEIKPTRSETKVPNSNKLQRK